MSGVIDLGFRRFDVMRRVAVVGVGLSRFGEIWERSFRELIAEAGVMALDGCNLHGNEIEALFVGTMASGALIGQEHIGALISDYMGLNPIPSTRIEAACASGGLAFRQAYMAVASGLHDTVIAGGVEKMTDVSVGDASLALGAAGDADWELFNGATFPGLYALMARRYMHEYGATEEQLAAVAVKNHKNAVHNPFAQFRKEITIDMVMKSKMVASPLKVFDCSPITDGAAVAVLMPLDKARKLMDDPVEVVASAQASDTLALHSRMCTTGIDATKVAAKKAFEMAKIKPKDVDFAEVHDCFTIAELFAIEDLGFFKKGEGARATEQGLTALNAKLSVNTSGGLKGKGHPVGATGVAQVVEATLQLQGKAGKRQVDGPEYGLTHNVGGSGATAVVHIFKSV